MDWSVELKLSYMCISEFLVSDESRDVLNMLSKLVLNASLREGISDISCNIVLVFYYAALFCCKYYVSSVQVGGRNMSAKRYEHLWCLTLKMESVCVYPVLITL